ncbi:hypothetical protein RJ639_009089 [Escallonia herrerae]|uniref:Uncharacterized protein n=1 Tax=Escallonia herrerae TaxID=1293975 RepID=A0AA88VZF6_9ASTE|nr:hypothetical protein RJ639_009089 [Escallonia herrerae]
MGMINQGIGTNGNPAMPNRPVSTPSPCFTSAPNQPFPLQNNMSHLGPGVFFPHNFNPVSMNQMNYSHQPNGQFFAQNSVNPFAYFNQNACLPNGQFCLPSPVQGMNHFAQMQMPNFVVPNNVPVFQCQVSHGMVPQNPNFVANQQLGMLQANGAMQHGNQGLILPAMNATPNPSQQLQGKSPLLNGFGLVQSQQSQNFSPQVFTKSLVTFIANGASSRRQLEMVIEEGRVTIRDMQGPTLLVASGRGGYKLDRGRKSNSTNQIPVQKKRWVKVPRRKVGSGGGTLLKKLAEIERKNCKWVGLEEEWCAKALEEIEDLDSRESVEPSFGCGKIVDRELQLEQNPSLKMLFHRVMPRLFYLQKVAQKMTEPEGTEKDAKLWRQQLKEILAKQAELGCEVAEIPSQYLSDAEKLVHGREEKRRTFNKKGRFQNKFNKRGRLHQNDRFTKKQRSAAHDSYTVTDQNDDSIKTDGAVNNNRSIKPAMNQREPTLLQKLLSADIRRDKSRLLQVFRFMVMNSFFKDWPEKPLRFPLVTVKENKVDGKGELVEDGYSQVKKGVFRGSEKTAIKKSYEDGEEANKICELERNEGDIRTEMEEEGEIID